MEADFSGYATKNGLKCSDGRTILAHAFKDQDGVTVPLVWQHQHDEPANILGHAVLENREDGVYAYGFFNDTPSGEQARELVKHGDVRALSIYANKLKQQGMDVVHGVIREVSLVLAGANPGAFIDTVAIKHGDDGDEEEAEIYFDSAIVHKEGDDNVPKEDEDLQHEGDEDGESLADIIDSMTDKQKNAMAAVVTQALAGDDDSDDDDSEEGDDDVEHSDNSDSDDSEDDNDSDDDSEDDSDEELEHQEGNNMTRNVFEGDATKNDGLPKLTHSQIGAVFADAAKLGSFKEAVLQHAGTWGINNIEALFPDHKNVDATPEWIKRNTEWVDGILNGASHQPFTRIRSRSADITHEEARAKGFIKGNLKKEQFFAISKRETNPFTVYKKQKLDRDDIIDITEFDVVAWIWAEMRMMLNEEIARAILLGDGRDIEDDDKIDETKIRPIANDDPFYTHEIIVDPDTHGEELVEAVLRSRRHYKGTGPAFYTTEDVLTDVILEKDKMGRRLYKTEQEAAQAMRVSRVVPVEVMEDYEDILGVIVNISDYTIGTDKGGKITTFDNFDIDYNTYKYLIEGRLSGALTKHKRAIVIRRGTGIKVTATEPTIEDNVITIPTVTGVEYLVDDEVVTGTVTITADTVVTADPTAGYYLAANTVRSWGFEFDPSV